MRDIRSLEQTLAQNLPWHRARIKFVAAFMLALVTIKNVNLVEIACAFAGKARQESQYKKRHTRSSSAAIRALPPRAGAMKRDAR